MDGWADMEDWKREREREVLVIRLCHSVLLQWDRLFIVLGFREILGALIIDILHHRCNSYFYTVYSC